MAEERGRERDLVLAPNEYAYIQDQTKGGITIYVGPTKSSLSNTDQPQIFDEKSKKFLPCELNKAIKLVSTAPEGWYIILKNPARDNKHPTPGSPMNSPDLLIGHKVNVAGPASFALWPGQMAQVVQGHRLRSNEYLVVRVYDEDTARESGAEKLFTVDPGLDGEGKPLPAKPVDLTMGRLFIIKGTDVSFFMPPNGMEVVRDSSNNGNYIRDAVTLERLEYCILKGESGNKRYVRGPDVVFPSPTETFVKTTNREGVATCKFNAIELNENSGIYIKVIDAYEDDDGTKHPEGEELFITGKQTSIYFPRKEHAVIKYNNGQGKQDVHFAIAIPSGEGRYVLDRNTGDIRTELGPSMLLPDPRYEVPVRRVLTDRQCDLWYPGNHDFKEHNRKLRDLNGVGNSGVEVEAKGTSRSATAAMANYPAGDEFSRRSSFTPPRTISLQGSKYDRAFAIKVRPGYAVQVVKKTGERRIVQGPHNILLDYDETLETMELSTGKPKTDATLVPAVYLKTVGNVVSDIVDAETSDLCKVKIRLSYRVNFEGDSSKWFAIDNYVKFLTQHLRSYLRNEVKRHGIEHFHANVEDIIRNRVLGAHNESGKRPGRSFEENGMRIYDVEVLNMTIENDAIAALLMSSQQESVRQSLTMEAERRRLELAKEQEAIEQGVATAKAETAQKKIELDASTMQKKLLVETDRVRGQFELNLAQLTGEVKLSNDRLQADRDKQNSLDEINRAEIAREKALKDLELDVEEKRQKQEIEKILAEANALVAKAGAVSPDLIAALQGFGDKALLEKVAAAASPLAIMGGTSVADVVNKLFRGTPLEKVLQLNGNFIGKGTVADTDEG